jgi:hypothetical protein
MGDVLVTRCRSLGSGVIGALGTISNAPTALEQSIADTSASVDRARNSRRDLAQAGTVMLGFQPTRPPVLRAGRQASDRTAGPFTRGGAHRLASSPQYRRRKTRRHESRRTR